MAAQERRVRLLVADNFVEFKMSLALAGRRRLGEAGKLETSEDFAAHYCACLCLVAKQSDSWKRPSSRPVGRRPAVRLSPLAVGARLAPGAAAKSADTEAAAAAAAARRTPEFAREKEVARGQPPCERARACLELGLAGRALDSFAGALNAN